MLNVEFNVYMASIDNKDSCKSGETVSHSCWYHCSLIPRLLVALGGVEERAWYPQFVHTLKFLGN